MDSLGVILAKELPHLRVSKKKGNHTHVNTDDGTMYFVSDGDYPHFYQILSREIEAENEVKIGEKIKATCRLIISFAVDRDSFRVSDVEEVLYEINRLLRTEMGRPGISSIACAVYWMGGRLFFNHPEIAMTLDQIELFECRLARTLPEPWSKCVVPLSDSPYVLMYTDRVKGMIGAFVSGESTHKSHRVDYEEFFREGLLTLREGKVIKYVSPDCDDVADYFHLLLSIHNLDFTVSKEAEEEVVEYQPIYDSEVEKYRMDNVVDFDKEDKVDTETMIDMWGDHRFESVSEWYTLGEVCYNYHKSRRSGIDEWLRLTKKIERRFRDKDLTVPSYLVEDVRDHIETHYYTFKRGRVTSETAAWIAREDSPEDYALWHLNWRAESMIDCLSCSITEMARAFWKKFFVDYMTESEGRSYVWYIFDKDAHRLRVDKCGKNVSKDCIWRFRNDFRSMRVAVMREVEMTKDAAKSVDLGRVVAALRHIEKSLMEGFGDMVVAHAARYFCNESVTSFLDKSRDLLCAKTGVVVSTRKDVLVRRGRPQDYLTKEIDAHYVNMTWTHPAVVRILYWIRQSFVDPELVEYWLMFVASLLRGGNPDKIFPIIYGSGNASKSAWVRVIQKMLGQKCVKGTMSLLTMDQTNPHGPTSLVVDICESHLALFEEAEEGGRMMKAGFIKNMTGADTIYGARKHKDGVQMTPSCVIGMVTNTIPETTTKDDAMMNRLVVIEIGSTWKVTRDGEFDLTVEEQFETRTFEADPYFDESAVGYGEAMLWISTNYYPKYLKKGLTNKPKAIQDYTDKYWRDKDMYFHFESEKVDVTKDEKDSIGISEAQELFTNWYTDAYPKKVPPSRPKLVEELSRRWKSKPVEGRWYGVKKRVTEEQRGYYGESGVTPQMAFGSAFDNY